MYKLTNQEELLSKAIVDCVYKVHRTLGPGLLEKVYEICFCHELTQKGISFQRQVFVPIVYDGIQFEAGLKLDVYVEDSIICELKAIENVNPVWQAQLLSHLKLTGQHVGFLVNFNTTLIKDGIRRFCIQ